MSQTVFRGWWVVGGSALVLFLCVGLGLYSPPVFLIPLQNEFGWSRAQITGGGALAALAVGVFSPLAGHWIERYGSRVVMSLGAAVMGVGFVLLASMQTVWQFYLCNLIAASGLACAAWIPNQTLVAHWFTRRRGLAMGISLIGIGLGGLVMAPLAGFLIKELGWRAAYRTLGSGSAAIVILVVLVLIRTRPSDLGLRPDGDPPDPLDSGAGLASGQGPAQPEAIAGLDLRQALRQRAFWIISLCNLLTAFGSMSIVAHLAALLEDADFGRQVAARSLGFTVGVSVIGRLLFGWLADSFSKKWIFALGLLLYAAAAGVLYQIRLPGALPLFVFVFGVALGGTAVVLPLVAAEQFGLRALGKILGLLIIASTFGAAIGPILTGHIFDVTGSYGLAIGLHLLAFLLAALAIAAV